MISIITLVCLLVILNQPAPAENQLGPPPFTDEAVARGVVFPISSMSPQFGFGLGFADLDGDGDDDLVALGRSNGVVGIYENDGTGAFIDRSAASGIAPSSAYSGVVSADYDADGDADLYLSSWETPNVLLRNDGGFTFTDVGAALGVDDDGRGQGCTFGDYDGDGWLDLYVGNYTDPFGNDRPNRLYRNLGGVAFVEVGEAMGVDDDQLLYQASFLDIDRDGDADLYLGNDKGAAGECAGAMNLLFMNVAGSLVDITGPSGTEGCVDSMCIAIGDFDRNGFDDLYVTSNLNGNALMMNQGNGTFVRLEVLAGVASFAVGWGAAFLDYDNDGHQDLYVCNFTEPNRLYTHDGTLPADDVAVAMGVGDPGFSYTVAYADVDLDGDLDMAVSSLGENLRLYINHAGGLRRSVRFRVVGIGPNRDAIGAQLRIEDEDGAQVRQVVAGCNFKSHNELVAHFGVDSTELLGQLVVDWPGGEVSRVLTTVPTNAQWTILPPERLGDVNGDGVVTDADVTTFQACFGSPVTPWLRGHGFRRELRHR